MEIQRALDIRWLRGTLKRRTFITQSSKATGR